MLWKQTTHGQDDVFCPKLQTCGCGPANMYIHLCICMYSSHMIWYLVLPVTYLWTTALLEDYWGLNLMKHILTQVCVRFWPRLPCKCPWSYLTCQFASRPLVSVLWNMIDCLLSTVFFDSPRQSAWNEEGVQSPAYLTEVGWLEDDRIGTERLSWRYGISSLDYETIYFCFCLFLMLFCASQLPFDG